MMLWFFEVGTILTGCSSTDVHELSLPEMSVFLLKSAYIRFGYQNTRAIAALGVSNFKAYTGSASHRDTKKSNAFSGPINITTSSEASPAGSGTGFSVLEEEKEMFQIRKKMTASYSQGRYQAALTHAIDLEHRAEKYMGRKNAVFASCVNNVALMHKMLGDTNTAMEKYTQALQVYLAISGKNHVSYASTLANLGVLYKDLARDARGMEKQELIQRASEALEDSLSIRRQLLGHAHKETLYSMVHLASLYRIDMMQTAESATTSASASSALSASASSLSATSASPSLVSKSAPAQAQAESMLREALEIAEANYGDIDIICSAIHNDLGLLYKHHVFNKTRSHVINNKNSSGSIRRDSLKSNDRIVLKAAETHYRKALEIRSKLLGDSHNDTIVTTHNLAELYLAVGNTEAATALQNQLQSLVVQVEDATHASTTSTTTTTSSSSSSTGNGTLLTLDADVTASKNGFVDEDAARSHDTSSGCSGSGSMRHNGDDGGGGHHQDIVHSVDAADKNGVLRGVQADGVDGVSRRSVSGVEDDSSSSSSSGTQRRSGAASCSDDLYDAHHEATTVPVGEKSFQNTPQQQHQHQQVGEEDASLELPPRAMPPPKTYPNRQHKPSSRKSKRKK